MTALLVLILCVSMVIAMGHGIWVLLARILAVLSTRFARHASPSVRYCPRCKAAWGSSPACRQCGWPDKAGGLRDPHHDLEAAERVLMHLQARGAITPEVHGKVMRAIRDEEGQADARQRTAASRAPAPPPLPMASSEEIAVAPGPARQAACAASDTPDDPGARRTQSSARPQHGTRTESPPPPEGPAPGRKLSQMLSTFMEEKNIRWGEIIGGMLIVLCSLALVISLWSEITAIPVLQFSIFTMVTAALFGMGLYMEHRWNLHDTARGLLCIASLLVPLNFLAIAAFTDHKTATDPLVICGEVLSFALYVFLLMKAGEVMIPGISKYLTPGVLGPCLVMLLARRFVDADTPGLQLLAFGVATLLPYCGTAAILIRNHWPEDTFDRSRCRGILTFLGLVLFSTLLAFGLLPYKTGDTAQACRVLAPLVSIAGVPLWTSGILFWRKVSRESLGVYRITGTATGMLGIVLGLWALMLAWPDPAGMLQTSVLHIAVFACIAMRCGLPAFHAGVAGNLVLAYLFGFHVLAGHVTIHASSSEAIRAAMFSVGSGKALMALFVSFLFLSRVFRRMNREQDKRIYACAAVAVSVISLLLGIRYGYGRTGDPQNAWWLFWCYAALYLAASWFQNTHAAGFAGSMALLAALAQTIIFRYGAVRQDAFPWQIVLLVHASIVLTLSISHRLRRQTGRTPCSESLWITALATSSCCLPLFLSALSPRHAAMLAARILWLGLIWCAMSLSKKNPRYASAFQAATVAATLCWITDKLQQQAWFQSGWTIHSLLQTRSLLFYGLGVALLMLPWCLARMMLHRKTSACTPRCDKHARHAQGASATSWEQFFMRLSGSPWIMLDRSALQAILAMLGVGMLCAILIRPAAPGASVTGIAGIPGWLLMAFALVEGGVLTYLEGQRLRLPYAHVLGILLSLFLSASLYRAGAGNWAGYHVCNSAAGLLACAPLLLSILLTRDGSRRRWEKFLHTDDGATTLPGTSLCIAALALILALRGTWSDPMRPWWTAGMIAWLALLAAASSMWYRRRALWYCAGALINLAAGLCWATRHDRWHMDWPVHAWLDFARLQALCLGITGAAALLMERAYGRTRPAEQDETCVVPFHLFAIASSLSLLYGAVMIGLLHALRREAIPIDPPLTWCAFAATGGLALVHLRYSAPRRFSAAWVYAWGLCGLVTTLDIMHPDPIWLAYLALAGVALYHFATGCLWMTTPFWSGHLVWSNMPRDDAREPSPPGWFTLGGVMQACFVLGASYWCVWTFHPGYIARSAGTARACRVAAGCLACLQALSIAFGAKGSREGSPLRPLALLAGVMGAVAFGWAWMEPGAVLDQLLDRCAMVFLILACMTALYGEVFSRRLPLRETWKDVSRKSLAWLAPLTLFALLFTLSAEVYCKIRMHAVPMHSAACILVALTLVLMSMTGIAFAVLPGRDPLGLHASSRTYYVYASEVLLALCFMHLRLTMPWIFTGIFARYWPLLIMGLAYLGVGASEMLRRKNLPVLSEPLEKTGAFLPLLPVLGYWFLQSDIHFSLLMLTAALLYGVLSTMRRSYGFALLASLAGNGGLWYCLHHTRSFRFQDHPQLWLIPLACAVLASAWLNRSRIAEVHFVSTRYACLTVMYLSSTVDIFLGGVAESPWLPMILAALSVLGILAGIMCRTRSFLYLGSAFLLLSLVTMVWCASTSLGWTWLWYLFGMGVGIGIIVLFAVFEKKRNEVLHMMQAIKKWEE